jgi:hypothetical protein
MRVFTYFRPDPKLPDAGGILPLWKTAWESKGVEPHVWTREPSIFPEFRQLERKIGTFPSINPQQYQRNNWMRWLAVREIMQVTENHGRFIHMLDSDIFPTKAFTEGAMFPDRTLVIWDASRCPCAVTLFGKTTVYELVEKILNATPPSGVKHYSDQEFFRTTKYHTQDVVGNWPEVHKPLVHISTNALIGAGVIQNANDKANALKQILPTI